LSLNKERKKERKELELELEMEMAMERMQSCMSWKAEQQQTK